MKLPRYVRKPSAHKELKGVDLFVHWNGTRPEELAARMHALDSEQAKLTMITNRGIKVYPDGFEETFCTDHWRCRFKPDGGQNLDKSTVIALLTRALELGMDVIKTENLYDFDGKPAYSLGQGQ